MKEQSEKLFRAIGDVGDDLIARADAAVKKAPRVWVKWAALAACCALVIGAAAFVVPMFRAGSSGLSKAAPPAETVTMEAPAEEEMTLEAAEAPAEAMESAPADTESADTTVRTLPATDSFCVRPETVTRTSADFSLTNHDGLVCTLRGTYRLERMESDWWQPLAETPLGAQAQADDAAAEAGFCVLHYDWQSRYGALEPGEYRLAQPVVLSDGTEYTLYAEFTVA